MKQSQLTPEYINSISYTDFVGLINQWNVLPGAHVSLSKWMVFSELKKESRLLEVACTTGFSSRELAKMTGCSGIGFDISQASVTNAIYNKEKYAPHIQIEYQVADGYQFEDPNKFTHVVVGAALRFFPDPERMLQKILSLLQTNGYILATEFYVTQEIPKDLIQQAQKTFHITPTSIPYKEVMQIYRGLDVIYEDDNLLRVETTDELEHYTTSTVDRACEHLNIIDDQVRRAIFNRLLTIKTVSNLLRPYQRYNTLVLRYDPDIYPRRFVELF